MRAICGQVQQLHPCVPGLRKPGLHGFGCVTAVVVHYQYDSTNWIGNQQMFQESQEVLCQHPFAHQIGPLPPTDIQGSEQCPAAIAARGGYPYLLADPMPHGSHQWQQLHSRLVSIQDSGIGSSGQHRLGDTPLLLGLLGVGLTGHRQAGSAPAQAQPLQGSMYCTHAERHSQKREESRRQHGYSPKGRQEAAVQRVIVYKGEEGSLHLPCNLARSAATRLITQALWPGTLEAAYPQAHPCSANPEDGTNFRHGAMLSRQKDHEGTLTHTSHLLAGHALEFVLFIVRWLSHVYHRWAPPLSVYHCGSARYFLLPT